MCIARNRVAGVVCRDAVTLVLYLHNIIIYELVSVLVEVVAIAMMWFRWVDEVGSCSVQHDSNANDDNDDDGGVEIKSRDSNVRFD